VAAAERDWIEVTAEELNVADISAWATRPQCGALVTFCGTVRNSSSTGQDIIALEYDTADDLARSRMGAVVAEARRRWPDIEAIAAHHRTGRVELGGVVVVVVVSSPHRREAFAAAEYCIDTIKTTVPMWKREHWVGGSVWSQEATPIADVTSRRT
jgi:molybdopterin synthase catalytic subunit